MTTEAGPAFSMLGAPYEEKVEGRSLPRQEKPPESLIGGTEAERQKKGAGHLSVGRVGL